jgi:hypothetical protein
LDARLRARLDAEPVMGLKVGRLNAATTPIVRSLKPAPTSAWFTVRLAPAFIALALVVGAVAGYVVRQQSTSSASALGGIALGPESAAVVARLSEELSLTDRQRQELSRILAPLEPLRAAAPSELANARVAVRIALTAAQRERFDQLGDNWSAP